MSDDQLREGIKAKGRARRRTLKGLVEASNNQVLRNDLCPLLALESIAVSTLITPKRKIRTLDPAHVRETARSIRALGFCHPVIVGKGNLVLDGQVRLEAAKQAGLTAIPCIRIEHLAEAEQRTLTIALNRLQEKGSWDLAALRLEFEELLVLDQPIEIAGFALEEIDDILFDNEDEFERSPLEPVPGGVTTIRPGDVFDLGPHRIVCGDARDPTVVALLMADTPPARLILTDEPYNVPIEGHVSGGNHREFAMAAGEMTSGEYLEFNIAWITQILPHLCEGGVLGSFIDWRGLSTFQGAADTLDLEMLNLIVWAKTNAGMGSLYRSQHELLPLFRKKGAQHINNIALGKKGRWRSNLWTYPGASSIDSDARRGLRDHPTVKPVAMLSDALLDLTNRNDVVLDPFLGSGSTLVACERTNRVCRGIELDPLYVELAVRRYRAAGNLSVLAKKSVF